MNSTLTRSSIRVIKKDKCFTHLSSKKLLSKRLFFASSTDHTTLLSNAQVHCINNNNNNTNNNDNVSNQKLYILLPNDVSLDLAKKVNKLHLARLSTNENIIFGAKVVQRTLGTESNVCKPLLDAALSDIISKEDDSAIALASLDGLCRWVAQAIEENETKRSNNGCETDNEKEEGTKINAVLEQWRVSDQSMYEAVKAIATGVPRPGHSVVGQGTYRDGEKGWMELAKLYIEHDMSNEGLLYKSGGGKLECIDHLANTSREALMYSGGAMARYSFGK